MLYADSHSMPSESTARASRLSRTRTLYCHNHHNCISPLSQSEATVRPPSGQRPLPLLFTCLCSTSASSIPHPSVSLCHPCICSSTFPDFYFPAISVLTSLIHQSAHLFPCSAHPKSHTGLLFLSMFNRCFVSYSRSSVCLCVTTSCFRRRLVSGFQYTLSKTCHNSRLFNIGQEDYKPQRMCKASHFKCCAGCTFCLG